ncbi:hypothetical protein M422DRAFT_105471, partial [Sphaerobolus stellatus SS14]
RHPQYYLKDGVVLQVEKTLFKVPRYMFENSSRLLADMLSEVPTNNDDLPVELQDVTPVEFEHLVKFLYPLKPIASPTDPTSSEHLDISQWLSILRLSTLFEMPSLLEVSKHFLSSSITDPIQKIILGRTYDHQPWVKEGFTALCLRENPLSHDEGKMLSKEDVISLAAAREEV